MPLDSFLRHLPGADLRADARIVVGFSGGLDSTALLHALHRVYGARVRAVHVHHGLHVEADDWAAHCRNLCDALGVPFALKHVMVREAGYGLEAAARDARHAAFAEQLGAGDILALAHHQDDQAETFLLHALRGSGPDGLAAMRPWQARGENFLWRPWLQVPRAEIEAYARAQGLTWIDDPSNTSVRFDRNYLRHTVMPLLKARWPHAAAGLARSAGLQAEVRETLADSALQMLDTCRLPGNDLRVDALMRFSVEDRARVLRAWVGTLGLPALGHAHLQQIERDVLAARHDAEPVFTWGDARMVRWRDVLHAAPGVHADTFTPCLWDGVAPLSLPAGHVWQLVPAQAFPHPYKVTLRHGGERIQLPGRRHRTEVKKLLQAMEVPVWQREALPLLVDHLGEVHAIGGQAVSDSLSHWLHETGARLVYAAEIDPAPLD